MTKANPPLSIETWVDVILAGTAHRSSHEPHAKLGQEVLHRYFVELPERYKADEIATRYFDEMIPAVASALRGFSVVRDIFQTNTETIRKAKDSEIKHLEHLDAMSPLNKDGIWGRILAALASIGLIAPLQASIRSDISHATQAWIFAGAASVAVSVIGLELFVQWLRKSQSKKIEMSFPKDINSKWQDESMTDYQKLLSQFIAKAILITEAHYPKVLKIDDVDSFGKDLSSRYLGLTETGVSNVPLKGNAVTSGGH